MDIVTIFHLPEYDSAIKVPASSSPSIAYVLDTYTSLKGMPQLLSRFRNGHVYTTLIFLEISRLTPGMMGYSEDLQLLYAGVTVSTPN
jgi:hypothetical protein